MAYRERQPDLAAAAHAQARLMTSYLARRRRNRILLGLSAVPVLAIAALIVVPLTCC